MLHRLEKGHVSELPLLAATATSILQPLANARLNVTRKQHRGTMNSTMEHREKHFFVPNIFGRLQWDMYGILWDYSGTCMDEVSPTKSWSVDQSCGRTDVPGEEKKISQRRVSWLKKVWQFLFWTSKINQNHHNRLGKFRLYDYTRHLYIYISNRADWIYLTVIRWKLKNTWQCGNLSQKIKRVLGNPMIIASKKGSQSKTRLISFTSKICCGEGCKKSNIFPQIWGFTVARFFPNGGFLVKKKQESRPKNLDLLNPSMQHIQDESVPSQLTSRGAIPCLLIS